MKHRSFLSFPPPSPSPPPPPSPPLPPPFFFPNSLGFPGTHSADQAGLKFKDPLACASLVLGLKASDTTT